MKNLIQHKTTLQNLYNALSESDFGQEEDLVALDAVISAIPDDPSENPQRHKVGDLVEITAIIYGHEFKLGDWVIITRVNEGVYLAESRDGSWFIADEECKAI